MFILVAVIAYTLFHTRVGTAVPGGGEHPRADTLGVNVLPLSLHERDARWRHRRIRQRSSSGLGRSLRRERDGWSRIHRAGGNDLRTVSSGGSALLTALIFGFAESHSPGKLAILPGPDPVRFLLMAPYIATIIVVAGVVGRAAPRRQTGSRTSR